ncbi:type II toxin-antitoxin system RelE family toxin [Brachyspira pilosicoli]
MELFKKEYWHYRVGDYRILSKIIDNELIIMVIDIGHRKNIYND